eukprot:scaffold68069_cov71-Phaeocystis_antarctica.AAC.4
MAAARGRHSGRSRGPPLLYSHSARRSPAQPDGPGLAQAREITGPEQSMARRRGMPVSNVRKIAVLVTSN